MTTELSRRSLTVGLFGNTELHFDDIEVLNGRMAIDVFGHRTRVSRAVLPRLKALLAGPTPGATLKESARRFSSYVAGPHSSRVAAESLLKIGGAHGASDIHIEGRGLRMRVNGVLEPFCHIDDASAHLLLATLKRLSECLPYLRNLPQEGRIRRDGVGADIRASFVPTATGERCVLRLFGRLRSIDELGLLPDSRAALADALSADTGLILISGRSGGGKTTTLYAALAHISATRGGAHLSLEDPVEQRLRNAGIEVDQIELCPERDMTGERMLVAALRQDIDVLCVGEIRTPAEAQLAVQAAHTGRLVLAGVHAASAQDAWTRLIELGADPTVLRLTLRAIFQQQLETIACECGAQPCAECAGTGRRRVLRAHLHREVPQ